MNFTEAINLHAFLKALGQLESLPPELAPRLKQISSQLETDPIAAISEMENVGKLHPPLAELYRVERLRLKRLDSEPERGKPIPPPEKNRPQVQPSYLVNKAVEITSDPDPVKKAKQNAQALDASTAYLLMPPM